MFDVFLQNTFYKESCEKSSGDEVAVEWVWWFRASDVQQAPAARLKRHSVHSVPRGRRPWAGGEPVLEKQTKGGSEDACTAAAPGSTERSRDWAGPEVASRQSKVCPSGMKAAGTTALWTS